MTAPDLQVEGAHSPPLGKPTQCLLGKSLVLSYSPPVRREACSGLFLSVCLSSKVPGRERHPLGVGWESWLAVV